jgi:hypothetical protein
MPEGKYTLIGYTDFMRTGEPEHVFTKEIFISSLAFPRTIIYLTTPETIYHSGDKAEVNVKLISPDGKPVRKKYTYEMFVNGEVFSTGEGKTDKTGRGTIEISLPLFQGSTVVSIDLSVKHSGVIDKNSVAIPVSGLPFIVNFYPEGGKLIDGNETKIGFITGKYLGEYPEVEGQVLDQDNTVITDFTSQSDGIGYFEITPDKNNPAVIRITKPEGIETLFELPEIVSGGISIKYLGEEDGSLYFATNGSALRKTSPGYVMSLPSKKEKSGGISSMNREIHKELKFLFRIF